MPITSGKIYGIHPLFVDEYESNFAKNLTFVIGKLIKMDEYLIFEALRYKIKYIFLLKIIF